MKKIMYNQTDYHCTLSSDFSFLEIKHEYWSELNLSSNNNPVNFTLEMKGENWEILWPNREGEIFSSSRIYNKIKKYNTPKGLTITYPSTASCRTLIFFEKSGSGLALLAPPEINGRVTEFRLNAHDDQNFSINISGKNSKWYSLFFKNFKELEEKVTTLQAAVPWPGLPAVETDSKWQVQVGLIGPDEKTEVPKNKGFGILVDISELMLRELGKDNILHVFGYSFAHDMGYPDYSPSSNLGGESSLKKSIKLIHQNGQKVVFYMNGRIAQKENVERDKLFNSVLKDNKNKPYLEVYHNRKFYVMNPSSENWQARLLSEAAKLKKLGADGIQLDQLGGRAAPLPAGEIWGKGYINLINALHKEGLTVWIQGLSDIYPADWFELTYRDVNVLKDGAIRGGTPLGTPDKRVFQISVPNQVLLIPLLKEKISSSSDIKKNRIIIDLNLGGEELFLYNSTYMSQLKNLMHKAVLN